MSADIQAQVEEDTIIRPEQTEKVKKGSIFSGRPGKAFLFSLAVPGAGQIYNKSYLRVPFVWGAVGGVGWYLRYTTRNYNCFRDAYISKIDDTPLDFSYCDNDHIDHSLLSQLSEDAIRTERDLANKYRQTAIIAFSLVWLANGVDAFVDAHLKEFDIDEDLSIDIGPKMENDPHAPMKMGIFVQF